MKRKALCLALLCLLGLAGSAGAVICTIDDVPAATLLLPYFEVDLTNPNGVTTLCAISTASDTAILAHVVVWSDLSVPVLDFNIYLTGYDVQTINLRDIFVSGILPQTASVGHDPGAAGVGHLALAVVADRQALADPRRPLRRPEPGRQHRPRLRHRRHGRQLHPAPPRQI